MLREAVREGQAVREGKLSAAIRDDKSTLIEQRGCGHGLEEFDRFLRKADLHVDASTVSN